jgi:hypothetical protein
MAIAKFISWQGEAASVANSGSDYSLTVRVVNTAAALTLADALDEASDVAIAPLGVVLFDKTLVRQKIGPAKQIAVNAWEVQISYGEEDEQNSQETPEVGTWKLKWSTGKTQQKLVRAKEKINALTASAGMYPLKELNLVMTWDGHDAKGIDVPFAEPTFQITKYYAAEYVTTAAFEELCSKCSPPHTNDDTWFGFEAGEVAYFGAQAEADVPLKSGSRIKPVPITFDFGYSPNLTAVAVGGGMTTDKKGWHVLDVRYLKEVDGDSLVPKPIHCHVWRIFDELDFATFFGIGGA